MPRDPRVLALAQTAVTHAGNIAQAAAKMGISRPYLSRYLNDDLESVESIEEVIVKHCDRRMCPYTGVEVEPEVCHRKALAPEPFGGKERHAYWSTCQSCPNKPVKESQ